MSRRESCEDLCEDRARKSADGVAAIEKHWLAVGLVKDFDVGSILGGNGHTIHVDPVTSIAIRRRGGGNDGSLYQGTGKLLGVDTTIDDGAAVAVKASDIKTESSAVDEALLSQVVDDQRVRIGPATQARTSTEDTNRGKFTVSRNTEELLADSGCCIAS